MGHLELHTLVPARRLNHDFNDNTSPAQVTEAAIETPLVVPHHP